LDAVQEVARHERLEGLSQPEIEVSKALVADFNFPMIDLMFYWVEQIRRYGGL
jgi:hypothetical protein